MTVTVTVTLTVVVVVVVTVRSGFEFEHPILEYVCLDDRRVMQQLSKGNLEAVKIGIILIGLTRILSFPSPDGTN
jgi:hypothetical protein